MAGRFNLKIGAPLILAAIQIGIWITVTNWLVGEAQKRAKSKEQMVERGRERGDIVFKVKWIVGGMRFQTFLGLRDKSLN